jgi:hypothetical protein
MWSYMASCLAQRGEQFFRQASEEQLSDHVHLAGRGSGYRSSALGSQRDFGRTPVPG